MSSHTDTATTAVPVPAPPRACARERRITGLSQHLVMVATLAGLYTLVVAPVADLSGSGALASGAWFAAAVSATLIGHELVHAVVATATGHRVRTIHLDYTGGWVEFPPTITAWAWLAALAAAPGANLAAGITMGWAWLVNTGTEPTTVLALARGDVALEALLAGSTPVTLALAAAAAMNLGVGVINLLPAPDLDGEKALEAALWCLGAPVRVRTATALVAGTGYGLGLIAVALLVEQLPLVVAASAGLYGAYVVHAAVQRARR